MTDKNYNRKKEFDLAQGGRRINIWLSEDENKRLDQMTSETGKSKSEILKQSLYQQRRVMDAQFADSIFRIGLYLERKEYRKIREEIKKICRLSNL